MGNEDGSESQFGFKDKAKAEETIKLLAQHELQYRKLTVRGLLGRAKRVLTLTKAEEKINNIKSAIEVFEKWLEENGGGSSNKNEKTNTEDKVETVSGLGFKDKEAAERTLKILEGRDPDYQKLAVKGLIGSSKRVLSGTKNEDKIKSIKEGVQVLEDFLDKFERLNMSKNNYAYLSESVVMAFKSPSDNRTAEFIKTYVGKAKGNYKNLRTLFPREDDSKSWDIIRNKRIKSLKEKISNENLSLFNEDGSPTTIHLQLIHWAYSPHSDKVKKLAEKLNERESERKKRKSSHSSGGSGSGSDSTSSKKKKSS